MRYEDTSPDVRAAQWFAEDERVNHLDTVLEQHVKFFNDLFITWNVSVSLVSRPCSENQNDLSELVDAVYVSRWGSISTDEYSAQLFGLGTFNHSPNLSSMKVPVRDRDPFQCATSNAKILTHRIVVQFGSLP